MTSTSPAPEQLSLLEANRLLLAESQRANALLRALLEQASQHNQHLADLVYLLNGFSSGGASISGYLADPLTQAYLAVMGPLLAGKLAAQEQNLPELMKGATLLARQLVEELAAYRSERSAIDYLEEQAELLHDPWKNDNADAS